MLVVGFGACRKTHGPSQPVITLTSPHDTLVIQAGDTVLISGSVTDTKNLHELFISFQNRNDGTFILNSTPYVHGLKQYEFRYSWITSSVPAVYDFNVEAKDHDSHTTQKSFSFTVN